MFVPADDEFIRDSIDEVFGTLFRPLPGVGGDTSEFRLSGAALPAVTLPYA